MLSIRRFAIAPIIMSILGVCASTGGNATAATRTRERLDADWRFLQETTPVNPLRGGGFPVKSWRWMADDNGPSDGVKMADAALDATGPDWKDAAPGDDVFHGRKGYAWFRATLPTPGKTQAAQSAPTVFFDSVDDNATVYLNGKRLLEHQGWDQAFSVNLAPAWRSDGPNVLAVLVQNNAGSGGISGETSLAMGGAHMPDQGRPNFNDRAWRTVHLPHDYVIEGTFDQKANKDHGYLPVTTAWYRKRFGIPSSAKGKSVWLDFDGVYRDSMVWLNGHYLGEHKSGYTGFRYDIAPYAKYGGVNTLAVYVDPRHFEGWWYEGGGIYRHVWLNIADAVHVAPDGAFVTSHVNGLGAGRQPFSDIAIRTVVENLSHDDGSFTVTSTVVRPDGKELPSTTSDITVPAGANVQVAQAVTDPAAQLWSIETPQLYRLRTVVSRAGKAIDNCDTPFGVRTIRFDANEGFFLNDKPVKIKGTCNHQDFAGLGVAMPDSLLAWRIQKLKSMGSNAYRCSHNEVASELLDACDRLGMIVMDENRQFGDTYAGKASMDTPASDLSDLKEEILRDRNHPSIIMWSLCNEEGIQYSAAGKRIGEAMKKVVNELDGSRPVTAAMNGGHGQGLSTVMDLEGVNYNPGVYDMHHRDHPNQPVYGSETASAVSTRGIYANDPVKGYVSAYDVNAPPWAQTTENAWEPIATRPFVAGGFVWTGFDYKGEPTPYEWPCVNSHFGVIDIAGFPKDNYFYYQAWWGDKPAVHILPHWNWTGQEGKPISVWAYGNGDHVELLLNGQSLGTKEMPPYRHVEWSVPYAPGALEARSYRDGKLIATDKVETAGAPAALKLTTDRTELTADGEDVTMISVEVLDAQGRTVPLADNLVMFDVAGPGHVAGVGNGDASSHEPDKANQRHAFNGKCLVVIGTSKKRGHILVTAHSPGLMNASLNLDVQAEHHRKAK